MTRSTPHNEPGRSGTPPGGADPNSVSSHVVPTTVGDNIDTVARLHDKAQEDASLLHRPIERLFRSLAQPLTLYLLIGLLLAWTILNTVLHLRGHSWDAPPFFWTQGALTLLSLLTSLSVLIVQARQGEMQERQARLELQINLLAEQKITKLIALVEELRRDLPDVPDRDDAQADEMQQTTDVGAVLEELNRALPADAHAHDQEPRDSENTESREA
ncbi:DUF1003 domain-containing protein [Deinococcus sp. KNUC1210]|uniref:DUF1003 domain-containing protein n=1 Tax=Deinococcus sp. KNUC1210 TaxID=2917691 RepID=UPI001EF001A6|nr:DUF1003 domain-containing protein [Deinococcus sp. KNUC1210]ULH15830.1 DUF1003 domain-containing protein [Deinococcus sp. KNUC1210]